MSKYTPDSVLNAVQLHGATRYFVLGREMGLTMDQINSHCKQHEDEDNLRLLFEFCSRRQGQSTAAQNLLEACKKINPPIRGAVEEELKKNGQLEIRVQHLTPDKGQERKQYTVRLDGNSTGKDLKKELYIMGRKQGVPDVEQQRLEFCDHQVCKLYSPVRDDQTLLSQNIKCDSVVSLREEPEQHHLMSDCLTVEYDPEYLLMQDVNGESRTIQKTVASDCTSQNVKHLDPLGDKRRYNPVANKDTECIISDYVILDADKPVTFTTTIQIDIKLNDYQILSKIDDVEFIVKKFTRNLSDTCCWQEVDTAKQWDDKTSKSVSKRLKVPVRSLAGQTVFVAIARSSSGKPIPQVLAKRWKLSILSREIQRSQLQYVNVVAVLAATSFQQSDNEDTFPSTGKNKYVTHEVPVDISMSVFAQCTLEVTTVNSDSTFVNSKEHISAQELRESRNSHFREFMLKCQGYQTVPVECICQVTYQPLSLEHPDAKRKLFLVSLADEPTPTVCEPSAMLPVDSPSSDKEELCGSQSDDDDNDKNRQSNCCCTIL